MLRDHSGLDQSSRRASRREVSRLQQNFELAIPLLKYPLNHPNKEVPLAENAELDSAE